MSIEVKVPQLPESVADATLVTWHKQPGDAVATGLAGDAETERDLPAGFVVAGVKELREAKVGDPGAFQQGIRHLERADWDGADALIRQNRAVMARADQRPQLSSLRCPAPCET